MERHVRRILWKTLIMEEEKVKQEIYFRPPAKVLVVDDSHLNRSFIVNTFSSPNYKIVSATDGEQGLKMAKEEKPELILLDIMMPNMDGFEVCRRLKSDSDTHDIPVIFITALDAIQDKLRAFEVGGVDFVTKPFNHKELIARVRTNVDLHRSTAQKENMYKIAMEEKRHESIARIAAGVSHNFNNMLGVAFGNIMLVESLVGDDIEPDAKDALNDVRKSLERMQKLVQKFLHLTNTDPSKIALATSGTVDLRLAIDEVKSNIEHQKQGGLSVYPVNIDNQVEENTDVICDSNHINEIIHLICSEVIETTAGKVKIIATSTSSDEEVLVSLQINNIPISEEVVESVFEPFTLPLTNVGTGLAFSVAKQLVELNNGKITATSPLPNCLRFDIQLKKAKS